MGKGTASASPFRRGPHRFVPVCRSSVLDVAGEGKLMGNREMRAIEQRLMAVYAKVPTPALEIAFNLLTYVSGVTYYVSATINPILYSIMSLKFRQAFRDTLMRCCGRRGAARPGKSLVSVTFPSGFRSTFRSSLAFETSDFTLLTADPPPYTVEALLARRLRNVVVSIDQCSERGSSGCSRKASSISNSSLQVVPPDAFERAERLSDRIVELGSCG
ncbi:hypothetical protein HPB48_010311 [Haemaphysalis longicornis]|uniref:Uncharacterized protein n=1 Tax=Haemaphysalis longicornis TaxID=44386 RepID=A0A9J6FUR5_HAELO|nr:hypothetical protein HPB48_010311 [Haemaphysalis longicornis]